VLEKVQVIRAAEAPDDRRAIRRLLDIEIGHDRLRNDSCDGLRTTRRGSRRQAGKRSQFAGSLLEAVGLTRCSERPLY
jgi:hypothetical protein